MKKLLLAAIALLGLSAEAHTAPIFGTVQISTTTTITPTRQNGAFNTSSGTVVNINSTNTRTQFLTVTSTASFAGVSGSTISYSSATFTNVTAGGVIASTITVSSLTATSANILGGTGAFSTLSASTMTATSITSSTDTVTSSMTVLGPATFATTIVVSSITPTHIVGTTTNDNATVGTYGQYLSTASTTALSVPSAGVYFDLGSMALTAGDWDVTGVVSYGRNGATISSNDYEVGISTFTGNVATLLNVGDTLIRANADFSASFIFTDLIVPAVRLSLPSSATVYLKGYFDGYTGGPPKYSFRLSARRVR